MNVMNVDSYQQPLVIGLIILAGVTFDAMRSSNRLKFPWSERQEIGEVVSAARCPSNAYSIDLKNLSLSDGVLYPLTSKPEA